MTKQIIARCTKDAARAHKRYKKAGGQQEYCKQQNTAYFLQKAAGYRPGTPLRQYYMRLARERMSTEQRKEQVKQDIVDLFGEE